MTIKALAESAGLGQSTLYNWLKESNPTTLGAGTLAAIAEVLEVEVAHLFYTVAHGPPPEEEARARVLRQIDDLLGRIDDPEEQDRAAALILATLRAYSDGYERQRTARPGARKAGPGPAAGPSSRPPRAAG